MVVSENEDESQKKELNKLKWPENSVIETIKILEDKKYGYKDFDRTLIVNERRKAVAKHLIDFLEKNGKYNKSILFCQNSEHALAMTKLLRNYSGEAYDYALVQ